MDFQSTNTSECVGWLRSWWFSDSQNEEDVDALHPSFNIGFDDDDDEVDVVDDDLKWTNTSECIGFALSGAFSALVSLQTEISPQEIFDEEEKGHFNVEDIF